VLNQCQFCKQTFDASCMMEGSTCIVVCAEVVVQGFQLVHMRQFRVHKCACSFLASEAQHIKQSAHVSCWLPGCCTYAEFASKSSATL